jgi:hypothetical protein
MTNTIHTTTTTTIRWGRVGQYTSKRLHRVGVVQVSPSLRVGSGLRKTIRTLYATTPAASMASRAWRERALRIPQSHSAAEPTAGRKPLSARSPQRQQSVRRHSESGPALPARD